MENERAKWRLRAARWRARAETCRDLMDRAAYENVAIEYELLADKCLDEPSSKSASRIPHS